MIWDLSVVFEIAPRYCVLDCFIHYNGCFIFSKGFLPPVVDIMVIWIKFTHSCPFCGFPGGSIVKKLPANAEDSWDAGWIPGLGRFPRVGSGNPLQYSCLENFMDRRAMWATVHRVTKRQTWLSTHTLLIPIHFNSLIPKMSGFTFAISCFTSSNLPWFMDLTFQVSMQYCSLQHQTLPSPPDTSTTECHFCFWSSHFVLSGSIQFSCSVVSDSLQPHGLQHTRLPCPSPTPGAYSYSCPLNWWCLPTILSLCCPLLLLPSIFPSIRVLSNESAVLIRWPKYWSFSFSVSPSNEYSGLISFRIDWLDLLAVQGTLRNLL